jgi:hypothetical protein
MVVAVMLSSCASFERLRSDYGSFLESADLTSAEKLIEKKKWYQKDRNKVLYYLELGALARMQGQLAESNEYLNKADYLIEDYRASAGAKGLAMASNPRVLPYQTEYFENIAVHYLKSLNYLQLNDLESARVEARRTNIRLQQLNDAVPDKPLKYRDDVLGHIIMGLSYEKNGEWNNAFIAYRNAADLFISDGRLQTYMGVRMPEQLKCDLVNLAKKLGFSNEVERYQRILHPKCGETEGKGGALIVFWENGQAPVKDELIVGFDVFRNGNNSDLRFVSSNNEFEYYLPPEQYNQYSGFSGINSLRVALPSYRKRFYPLKTARVDYAGGERQMELIEDLSMVAQQSLKDRFHRELATALIRLAVKEATEAGLREIKTKKKEEDDGEDNEKDRKEEKKEEEYDETAGILLSGAMNIVNTLTERADIRSWNALPGEISYVRVPLKSGSNLINVTFYNQQRTKMEEHRFTVTGTGGLQVKNLITPDAQVVNTPKP